MQNIVQKIEGLVEERSNAFIEESVTFKEAVKKAKAHSLTYNHGEIGNWIDKTTVKNIERQALSQTHKRVVTNDDVPIRFMIDGEAFADVINERIKEITNWANESHLQE